MTAPKRNRFAAKPAAERKKKVIGVPVTKTEHAHIKATAHQHSLTTAAYCRNKILEP